LKKEKEQGKERTKKTKIKIRKGTTAAVEKRERPESTTVLETLQLATLHILSE
jgi:hypothetical protein